MLSHNKHTTVKTAKNINKKKKFTYKTILDIVPI